MEWVQEWHPDDQQTIVAQHASHLADRLLWLDEMLKAICTDDQVESLLSKGKAVSITNNSALTAWDKIQVGVSPTALHERLPQLPYPAAQVQREARARGYGP